ncbi:DEAD/DEAH box helicase [Aquiluna sp.]|nr:DEAD/DEAH box helicase [Aquiluna sp.]
MMTSKSNEMSPAEKYQRAKEKAKYPQFELFSHELKFPLDDFQEKACLALEAGSGVLVAAPTGAGKTIVGEFAIHLALAKGQKVFYTTPIKALSNQKFAELAARYGKDRVGLLTGDTNNNSEAEIVVITTEVLRNMIYATSTTLMELGFVVMDEVHYLADRFRGAVWEEVILHLPKDVKVVSLSATVSNAEEFGAWLAEVRGNTQVIVSEIRPVPLHQHVLFGDEFLELFETGSKQMRVNPELLQKHQARQRAPHRGPKQRGNSNFRGHHDRRFPRLEKPEVVDALDRADLLPAIFFIFSRVGCEASVAACRRAGVRLTTREEALEIRQLAEARCSSIADEDLDTLGYFEWLSSLERGYAAHHAGMLPAFKEVVEELFLRKLVRVVFATETLALGINMPARTVVLERLDKFNGEARVSVTAGEYTQLTGRAGRRGIDTEGHSVILWGQQLDPNMVAGLASKRTYPLNSSFKPTYNMAVNLIDAFGAQRASKVLERSFAQFQADRSVVGLAQGIAEKQASLEGYEEAMQCHLGDFIEYSGLRRRISDLERKGASWRSRGGKDIRQTKGMRKHESEIADLKRTLRSHNCHGCSEREAHARWGERYQKLRQEIDAAVNQIENRTNQVAKVFTRICNLLEELNYLQPDDDDLEITEAGKKLGKIYGERDLLIAQCINQGVWKDLDAPSLAGMAATLVYENRRDDGDYEPKLPKGNFRDVLEKTELIQEELAELQDRFDLTIESPLDLGLAWPIYRWATGARLDDILKLSGMLAGDFIRWSKQVIDVLDQLAQGADADLAETAYNAMDLVKRGIVAYSYYV